MRVSPIETPKRLSTEPLVAPRPSLSATAATAPLLTFVVDTTRHDAQGSHRSTQTVTRGPTRVRVGLPEGHQEWLFEQNRLYPDRVSGYLIDHDARQVRFYDETPLRNHLGVRGWMDVLTIRFDAGLLGALRQTGERRAFADATGSRFVGADGKGDGLVEVWWSDELLLPLSVTQRSAGSEVTSVVDRLTRGGDAIVLADPADRFPAYQQVDASDAGDH